MGKANPRKVRVVATNSSYLHQEGEVCGFDLFQSTPDRAVYQVIFNWEPLFIHSFAEGELEFLDE